MGRQIKTKLKAKAAVMAIKPPWSLLLMASKGADIPGGRADGTAEAIRNNRNSSEEPVVEVM